jgi:hypothetical protein
MGQREKLISRFMKLPKDFTFDETKRLLNYFGYEIHNKGNTSGSRIRFINKDSGEFIDMHKPHPESIMKEWMMKKIYLYLMNKKLI